uniref:Uncharacterized protein n=1 Tax=Glossina brevipalpis TaxID=37001 RepID=A0A1A9W2Y2_9MUSC
MFAQYRMSKRLCRHIQRFNLKFNANSCIFTAGTLISILYPIKHWFNIKKLGIQLHTEDKVENYSNFIQDANKTMPPIATYCLYSNLDNNVNYCVSSSDIYTNDLEIGSKSKILKL